jgi:hypothetical protein
MAVIKSGDSTDELKVDPTSKAARVTLYDTDGNIVNFDPVSLVINDITQANNDLISPFDASAYKFIELQLTGTWVGKVKFQASSDLGTWFDVVSQNVSERINPYVDNMTSTGGVKIPVMFKYLRVRVTDFTSGVVSGVAFGHKEDSNTGQISAVGVISGTVSLAEPTTLSNHLFISTSGNVNVNSQVVSGTATILKSLVVTCNTATPRHLKIYNTSTTPVAGQGTPIFIVSLPAVGTIAYPLSLQGQYFSEGIGITMTLGVSNSDVTPATTNGDMSAVFQFS